MLVKLLAGSIVGLGLLFPMTLQKPAAKSCCQKAACCCGSTCGCPDCQCPDDCDDCPYCAKHCTSCSH
jgi:hypothetical protein